MRQQPEEIVRQQLYRDLVDRWQFPPSMIALECKLSTLPHLRGTKGLVHRRCDMVCFAPDIHPTESLFPLLLIECKAVSLNAKALEQMLAYNYFIGAYFGALANADGVLLGWRDQETQNFVLQETFLPYPLLQAHAQGRV